MQNKHFKIIDGQDLKEQKDQGKCNCCRDCIWEKKVELSTGETYNLYRLWEIMNSVYGS